MSNKPYSDLLANSIKGHVRVKPKSRFKLNDGEQTVYFQF